MTLNERAEKARTVLFSRYDQLNDLWLGGFFGSVEAEESDFVGCRTPFQGQRFAF